MNEVVDSIKSNSIRKFIHKKIENQLHEYKNIKSNFQYSNKKLMVSLWSIWIALIHHKTTSCKNFYETEFSNVGEAFATLAVKTPNRFEATRDKVQKYLNAKHREEIIFTKGATEAINLVASSF